MWEKQIPEKYINWGVAVFAFAALFVAAAYFFAGNNATHSEASQASVPNVPAVLGAEISPRGNDTNMAAREPVLVSEAEISSVTAKSFLVYDTETGKTLLEKNGETQVSIASLTKLLTALVVYEKGNLDDYFKFNPQDAVNFNPVLGLVPYDEVKVHDVFNAMLVGSENDAAQALGRYVFEKTGENFIQLMNKKAKELGMEHSNFSNPLGFDSWRNYSTAEDLKKLAMETQKYAVFTNLGKTRYYSFESKNGFSYRTVATNKLLNKDSTVEAIKTGYTLNTQGAMIVKVANRNHPFVIIVLGSQDREADTMRLKEIVEKSFSWE